MEETEINDPVTPAQPKGLLLLEDAQYYLTIAGKWAKFLGVMGFIFTAFIGCAALFVMFFSSALQNASPAYGTSITGRFGGFIGAVYLLVGLFYFFISLYIYQFGDYIKDAVAYQDSALVTEAFGKLKSFLKTWGITTIVIIALYVLIFIGMIIGFSMLHR